MIIAESSVNQAAEIKHYPWAIQIIADLPADVMKKVKKIFDFTFLPIQ